MQAAAAAVCIVARGRLVTGRVAVGRCPAWWRCRMLAETAAGCALSDPVLVLHRCYRRWWGGDERTEQEEDWKRPPGDRPVACPCMV